MVKLDAVEDVSDLGLIEGGLSRTLVGVPIGIECVHPIEIFQLGLAVPNEGQGLLVVI